jgi:predicted GNAT superfamily acetyltransferase
VQLAERDGRIVGFANLPCPRGGIPHLHSDMLAVLPEEQGHGVGEKLKWAQREEALARGVTLITWTYDPLQAQNANLNLRRLAAVAPEFQPDFYGITTSSLHHGLPTDRLIVHWDLNAPRVRERASQGPLPRTATPPQLPRINDVKWQAGWPVSSDPRTVLTDEALLLEIPPDWNVLCQAAPRVAELWHAKVRAAFSAYLSKGFVAADFVPAEGGGRRRPGTAGSLCEPLPVPGCRVTSSGPAPFARPAPGTGRFLPTTCIGAEADPWWCRQSPEDRGPRERGLKRHRALLVPSDQGRAVWTTQLDVTGSAALG